MWYAGFGNHLARPLFRKRHRPDMSEEEATALIREALEVLSFFVLLVVSHRESQTYVTLHS